MLMEKAMSPEQKTQRAYAPRLGIVCGGRGVAAVTGPVGVEELAPGRVQPLIGVGAEVVPLGLQQVRGQPLRGVAVEIAQR